MIVGALAGVLSISDYRIDVDAVASVHSPGSILHDRDSWIADARRAGRHRSAVERLAAEQLEVADCAARSVNAPERLETGLCVVLDPAAIELSTEVADALGTTGEPETPSDPVGPDLPLGVAVARGHSDDMDLDRLEHWPSAAHFDAASVLPVGPDIPEALIVARAGERLARELADAERLRVAELAEQQRAQAAEELRIAQAAEAAQVEEERLAEADRIQLAQRSRVAEQAWLAEHDRFAEEAEQITASFAAAAQAESDREIAALAKADALAAADADESVEDAPAEDQVTTTDATEDAAGDTTGETVAVVTEIDPPAMRADSDQPALTIMAGIFDGSLLPEPEPVIDPNAPVGPEVDPELLVARRQEAERLADIERNRPVGPDIADDLLAARNEESVRKAEAVTEAARIEAEAVAEAARIEAEKLAVAAAIEAEFVGPPLPAFAEICKARFEDPLGLGEQTVWVVADAGGPSELAELAERAEAEEQESSLMTVYVTADGEEVDYDPDATLPFDPLAASPFGSDPGSKTRAAFENMLAADDGVHTVRYIKEFNHELSHGETLSEVLSATGLGAGEVDRWVRAMQTVYNSNRVYAGQELRLTIDMPDRVLKRLQLDAGRDARVTVEADGDRVLARKEDIIYERSLRVVDARIDNSLYVSAIEEQIPDRIISEMAEILGWEIEFGRDLRPGASFRAIYERLTRVDNAETLAGRVLAVEVSNRGELYEGFYYEVGEDGNGKYYDRNGESLGRTFLRFPVSYSRISSPYSTARYHPVLKRRIPHYGVDFAAPTGTPVRAVADGRVLKSGWYGGNGRFVKIRHDSVYESGYAHLSRIASSVTANSTVKKGQVIGYVGSTGLATGPHLHFAMYQRGKYIDPMQAELPRAKALSGDELAGFKMKVAMMDRAYAEAGDGEERSTQVAAVEAPADDAPH
jgi:murein DD-endopeptidase MepM/ murein hydrolase activator NlpD